MTTEEFIKIKDRYNEGQTTRERHLEIEEVLKSEVEELETVIQLEKIKNNNPAKIGELQVKLEYMEWRLRTFESYRESQDRIAELLQILYGKK